MVFIIALMKCSKLFCTTVFLIFFSYSFSPVSKIFAFINYYNSVIVYRILFFLINSYAQGMFQIHSILKHIMIDPLSTLYPVLLHANDFLALHRIADRVML